MRERLQTPDLSQSEASLSPVSFSLWAQEIEIAFSIAASRSHFYYTPSVSLRLSVGQAPLAQTEKPITLGEYLKQLSSHRNFMWFVSMNLVQVNIAFGAMIVLLSVPDLCILKLAVIVACCFIPPQVFHCHFNNNFFPLFLEHLLSDRISASTGSFLLGKSMWPLWNNLHN